MVNELFLVVFFYSVIMATSWLAVVYSHPIGARLAYYPSLLYGVLRANPNRQWYNRIDDRIILGALPFHKTAHELIQNENIGAVISLNESYEMRFLCPSKQKWKSLGIRQLHIPTVDYNNAPSLENIKKSMEFVNEIDTSKSIYVHCKAGRSRSATVVVCYLIKYYKMSITEAMDFVRNKRPHIVLANKHVTRINEFNDSLS